MNLKNYLKESSEKPVIPFVIGPTASGKSAAALELAKKYNGEIISADSMQIYKEMDIGTATPTKEEQNEVKHHLINIVSPEEEYSVYHFTQDANKLIKDILNRGKLPIICGGTGLYINSLLYSYNHEVKDSDPNIRAELEDIAKTEAGKQQLYEELLKVDPDSAEKIHPNNIKRVIRALEIFRVSGTPKSVLDKSKQKSNLFYEPLLLSPKVDRDELYNRINLRVDQMIENGLLKELKDLDKKYDRNLISMQAIGYKELFPYLDGEKTLNECVEELKKETRHFAKRQLTWFRRFENINYF